MGAPWASILLLLSGDAGQMGVLFTQKGNPGVWSRDERGSLRSPWSGFRRAKEVSEHGLAAVVGGDFRHGWPLGVVGTGIGTEVSRAVWQLTMVWHGSVRLVFLEKDRNSTKRSIGSISIDFAWGVRGNSQKIPP